MNHLCSMKLKEKTLAFKRRASFLSGQGAGWGGAMKKKDMKLQNFHSCPSLSACNTQCKDVILGAVAAVLRPCGNKHKEEKLRTIEKKDRKKLDS